MKIVVMYENEDNTLHCFIVNEETRVPARLLAGGTVAIFDSDQPQEYQLEPEIGIKLKNLFQAGTR